MFPAEYREHGIRRVLTPREGPVGLANATEPIPQDSVPTFDEYRVGPSDFLGVTIEDFIQAGVAFNAQIEVQPNGMIRLPQLGLVKVSGMTEAEVEQELRQRAVEARILANPIVTVSAVNRRQLTFSILGSVRNPGLYPITFPDFRVLDAMGLAGDIGAGVRKIYVIRQEQRLGGGAETQPPAPTDTAPRQEPLVIPVDDGEEPPGTNGSFFTRGGGGQESQPTSSQDAPTRGELDEILAPSAQTRPVEPTPTPGGERRFQPLVFDPSGKASEAPGAPTPEQPGAAPATPDTRREPAGVEPDRKPFDWETAGQESEAQRVIEIDVAALKAGDPKHNIVIRNRDVLMIPIDTGVYYMMGEVARPGVYSFAEREITLKQAVAAVGGFTALAWPGRCEIIRREKGTDKQITIPVNLDAIFAGLEDDILLRDDDVVNVGTHVVAPFLFVIRNSFRFTYGFGFVYDRNFADRDSYGGRQNPEVADQIRRQQRGLPF